MCVFSHTPRRKPNLNTPQHVPLTCTIGQYLPLFADFSVINHDSKTFLNGMEENLSIVRDPPFLYRSIILKLLFSYDTLCLEFCLL